MNDQATISMMMNRGLGPPEQEKIERLDGAVAVTFHRAGYAVRLCQGRTADDGSRWLDFCVDLLGQKIVASVSMDEFLTATDGDVVRLIEESCQ
jgi:hypothetical protein